MPDVCQIAFFKVVSIPDVRQIAFLKGDLHKEVYMTHSYNLHMSGWIYHQRCTLYGLKQAPCAWFEKFYTNILRFDFHLSSTNLALFTFHSSNSDVIHLIYVDDIILTANDVDEHLSFQSCLFSSIWIDCYLVIFFVLSCSIQGYILSQLKYTSDISIFLIYLIEKLLKHFIQWTLNYPSLPIISFSRIQDYMDNSLGRWNVLQ